MTHTYAARRLLELGPLTFTEMREITRWKRGTLKATLQHLMSSGTVEARRVAPRRNEYVIAQC